MENQTTNTQTVRLIPVAPVVNKSPEIVKEVVSDIGHAKILPCLYLILDAFERCQLDFFLVKQTARDAIAGKQLSGDHIDIGVRNNEWASDAKDILFAYFGQEGVSVNKQEPGIIGCVWQDAPFTIHLYDDNDCVTSLIPIAYEYESWLIPNQFARFEKEFDK